MNQFVANGWQIISSILTADCSEENNHHNDRKGQCFGMLTIRLKFSVSNPCPISNKFKNSNFFGERPIMKTALHISKEDMHFFMATVQKLHDFSP